MPTKAANNIKLNKAGYTATSCGRVGRGGNARFPTFNSSVTDQPTDQPTNRRTDGQSLSYSCVSATKTQSELQKFFSYIMIRAQKKYHRQKTSIGFVGDIVSTATRTENSIIYRPDQQCSFLYMTEISNFSLQHPAYNVMIIEFYFS